MALFWVPGPLPYDYPASLQHSWHPGRYCYYALLPALQRRKQVLREVKSFGPGCTAGGCRGNWLVSESLVVLRLGCGLWGYWG